MGLLSEREELRLLNKLGQKSRRAESTLELRFRYRTRTLCNSDSAGVPDVRMDTSRSIF